MIFFFFVKVKKNVKWGGRGEGREDVRILIFFCCEPF